MEQIIDFPLEPPDELRDQDGLLVRIGALSNIQPIIINMKKWRVYPTYHWIDEDKKMIQSTQSGVVYKMPENGLDYLYMLQAVQQYPGATVEQIIGAYMDLIVDFLNTREEAEHELLHAPVPLAMLAMYGLVYIQKK